MQKTLLLLLFSFLFLSYNSVAQVTPPTLTNKKIAIGANSAVLTATNNEITTNSVTLGANVNISNYGNITLSGNVTLPPEAVVTSANITFSGFNISSGSIAQDFHVATSGAGTLQNTILSNTTNTNKTYTKPISNLTNGTITLTIYDNFHNPFNTTSAIATNIILTYTYTITKWYDSSTGGNLLGTGNTLETVSTSVLPSTTIAGTYNFYAEAINALGTSSRTLSTVTVVAPLNAFTTSTNLTCNGIANGSATAVTSGGTPPFTYQWSPGGSTQQTISALSSGTYTLKITDDIGQIANTSVTINQPSVLSGTLSTTSVSCNGGSNGTATITASGGAGGYTYLWSTGATTSAATGLIAGTYSVTVTDANLCTATQNFTITEPSALSLSAASQTNIACNSGSTGAASVNVATGGTANYTYDWTPGSPTGDGTRSVTGLKAGTWTCTVTDANGCTATQSFNVTQPTALSLSAASQTNVSCNNGSNGSATVSANGGAGGYTYSWAPSGGNAATATGLAAGNYIVTVTDANSCTATQSFTITQADALPAPVIANNTVTVFKGAESVSLSAVLQMQKIYVIANDINTSIQNGNPLLGQNLPTIIPSITTITIPPLPQTLQVTKTTIEFIGTKNNYLTNTGNNYFYLSGIISQGVTNFPPYNYAPPQTDTFDVQNIALQGGNLTLTASYNGGTLTPAHIADQARLVVNYTDPAISIKWYDSPTAGHLLSTASTFDAVRTSVLPDTNTPGDYIFYAETTDGTCSSPRTPVTVKIVPPSVTITSTDVSCNGGSDSTATASITGGTAPYTYSWNTTPVQTAATATNLSAGNYTVTVTDAYNYKVTESVIITQPDPLPVPVIANNTITVCKGTNSISLSAVSGQMQKTYIIANNISATTQFNIIGSNITYNVIPSITTINIPALPQNAQVIDTHIEFTGTSLIDINTPPTFSLTGIITKGITNFLSNAISPITFDVPNMNPEGGNLKLTVNSYTQNIPFTANQASLVVNYTFPSDKIKWYDSPTAGNLLGSGDTLAAVGTSVLKDTNTPGNYTFYAETNNGSCSSSRIAVTVKVVSTTVTSTSTNVSCNGGTNGAIDLTPSGGTAPYTFNWNDGITTEDRTGLASGTYNVTVTDVNLCSATQSFTITQPTALMASLVSQTNIACNGATTGAATVSVTGGTPGYSYSWAPTGGNAATATGLGAGTYTVTVTDANSCTATQSFTITEPNAIVINTQPQDQSIATNANTTLSINASNVNRYQWQVNQDGNNWTDITNGGTAPVYGGATSATLTLTNVPVLQNGYQYRVVLFNAYECANESNKVILSVSNPLGTEKFDNIKFTLYPNPASKEVFFTINNFVSYTNMNVTIYDLNGKLIKETKITSELQPIEVTGLESGVYIFTLTTDKEQISKRLVINKTL